MFARLFTAAVLTAAAVTPLLAGPGKPQQQQGPVKPPQQGAWCVWVERSSVVGVEVIKVVYTDSVEERDRLIARFQREYASNPNMPTSAIYTVKWGRRQAE